MSSYSLADTTGDVADPDLTSFSLARDEKHVLPALRRARELNPELRVMLTPWSAPAWMKTNRHLHGGSLAPEHYGSYARYLLRAVDAYRAAGAPVDAVTVVNEPLHATGGYPSMGLSAEAARTLLGQHLGPALQARGGDVRVFGYDHNWDDTRYPSSLLADPVSGPVLAGTAWHCYGGDVSAQETVRRQFPEKEVFTSECTGGEWAPDFGSNLRWNAHVLVVGAFRSGSSGLTLWNLALDPSGGPTNGGCQDCRGVLTVDPASGTVTRNVEYYVLGHLAKFVRPGAVRVGSSSYGAGYVESVAFRNPDGSHVAVVHNNGGSGQTVAVRHAGRSTSVTLPAGSLTTLTW